MRVAYCCVLSTALLAGAAVSEVRIEVRPDGSKLVYNTGGERTPRGPSRPLEPEPEVFDLVERHAADHRLDPRLVDAVIRVESAYDPRAVSHKGAIGLMQLMPETARVLSVDPWEPEDNVAGGTRYLRSLLDRFDGDLELALAGYNAGPLAVERHRGVPPYQETRSYVEKVLRLYYGDSSYRVRSAGRKVFTFRDADGRLVMTTSPPS